MSKDDLAASAIRDFNGLLEVIRCDVDQRPLKVVTLLRRVARHAEEVAQLGDVQSTPDPRAVVRAGGDNSWR